MAKKIKCSVIVINSIILFLLGSMLPAFEWPQTPIVARSLFSEMRGDGFNTSFVFSSPGEVAAAESGQVVMFLEDNQSNMEWFDSPLGNTVLIAHKNDMLSVYSNLVNVKVYQADVNVEIGEIIALSGQSAWKEENDGAVFQVIDTKMKTLINPIVLMQTLPESARVAISGLVAVDRSGNTYTLYNGASLHAGPYTLYMQRPENGMVHKSSVTLNGELKEAISYDTIGQEGNSLVVYGNKSYKFDDVYPDETTMRLAELLLSRGTNTIEISLSNAGGTQTFARYRISVN